MSVLLEPLETRSLFETALPAATLTASQTGSAFELPDADGPVVVLVPLGEVAEETALAVAFEESETGAAWSAVAGSAVPGLASGGLALHAFARTKRFLRCRVTVAGDDPSATLAVLVGQGCKVF